MTVQGRAVRPQYERQRERVRQEARRVERAVELDRGEHAEEAPRSGPEGSTRGPRESRERGRGHDREDEAAADLCSEPRGVWWWRARAHDVPQDGRARAGARSSYWPQKRSDDAVDECDTQRAQERPRHRPGVGVVVPFVDVGYEERVVGRLRVERLLDLREGAGEAVRHRCAGEEQIPRACLVRRLLCL